MTEFPELQQALVDAAGRRYARAPLTWRLARPLLVAAVCAGVAVVVIVLAGTGAPDTEQPAAPKDATADTVEGTYGVFRRPATSADTPPDTTAVLAVPMFEREAVRLVAQDGALRVYLAGGTFDGSPALCTFALVVGGAASTGCGDIGDPGNLAGSSYFSLGRRDGLIVPVPDGIDELTATFADDTTVRLPVRDNAVLLSPLERAPVRLEWEDAAGRRHTQSMSAERRSP